MFIEKFIGYYKMITLLLIFKILGILIFFMLYISDALMKALSSGKEGFTYLSRVVVILLQTLLQDQISEVSSHTLSAFWFPIKIVFVTLPVFILGFFTGGVAIFKIFPLKHNIIIIAFTNIKFGLLSLQQWRYLAK